MNLYSFELFPYSDPEEVPLQEIKEGPLYSISQELLLYTFSFFSCRSIATVASVSKKWQVYSESTLKAYKLAILATSLELHKVLSPYREGVENTIFWTNYKARFMHEHLGPARLKWYEQLIVGLESYGSKKRFSEELFDCIARFDQGLKNKFTTILLPPTENNRMMKHAVVYLRLALSLQSVFYICPLSAEGQLKNFLKVKIEALVVHRLFAKDVEIMQVFLKYLPEFKSLKHVIITACWHPAASHSLKPLLKAINKIENLQTVTFFSAQLSEGDVDVIMQNNNGYNISFQYEYNMTELGFQRMKIHLGDGFKRVGC